MRIVSSLASILTLGLVSAGLFVGPAMAQDRELDPTYPSELNIYTGEAPDMCDPELLQVRIDVNNVEAGGALVVELYNDDADNFLSKEARLRRIRIPATDGPMSMCLTLGSTGTYALAGYHDKDADRKLDRKWNFLPKEPFALSLNRRLKLRKPRLEEAAFEVGEDGIDLDLNLRTGRG
ncbi:MAG: DUF2141 domain-containing protein [Hyphomonadaceae bacterium]